MTELVTLAPAKPTPDVVALNLLYNPFDVTSVENHDLVWQPGVKMDGYLEGLPTDVEWMLFHNGVEFSIDQAPNIAVERGDAIALIVIPTKGDALKSILRTIVTIGFMVVGFMIAGPLGAAIGGMIAGLVNSFLLAPKKKKSKDGEDNSSYGIDGAKNSATEGIPYPVVMGEFRVAGNLADCYTENVGDDQYLYMRSVLSDGLIDSINDIEINEQPIANFTDVTVRKSLGTLTEDVNDWFRDSVRQVNKNIKLDTSWIVHQTTAAVDKVRFDVGFTQGLVSISEKKGTYKSKSVTFEMEYRPISPTTHLPTGAGTWLSLPSAAASTYNSTTATPSKVTGLIDVAALVFSVKTPLQTAVATPAVGQYRLEGSSTWIDANLITPRTAAKAGYAFDPANDGTLAGDTDITPMENATFGIDGLAGGTYEVNAVNGVIDQVVVYPTNGSNKVTVSDNRTKQIRRSFESVKIPLGFYEFRIRRTTAISTNQYEIDETYITDIAEIETGAVALRGTANLSLRIKLTDQLNNIPTVTARVKGAVCQQYDMDGNPTIKVWTNNQAWLALDMLCGLERGSGVSTSRIDWPRWVDFANYCTANSKSFNANIEQPGNLADVFNQLLRSAHAAPVPFGTKMSVVIDRARAPTTAFTQANIIKGSFGITYLPMADRANEFEVSYYDKTDRNKQKTIRYVDPKAVSFSEIPRLSQIDLIGCDNIVEARAELWRNIYANRLIIRSISLETFIDSINVGMGDVALIQHDQMDWADSGRIKTGSTTTVINTDQPLEKLVGSTYSMLVHFDALNVGVRTVSSVVGKKILVSGASIQNLGATRLLTGALDLEVISVVDGGTYHTITVAETPVGVTTGTSVNLWKTDAMEERTVSSVALAGDGTAIVTLATPLPGAPEEFSNFIYGKVNLVNKPYTVTGISGQGVEKRKLALMEYQAGVYAAGEIDIPIPVGVVSDRDVDHVQTLLFDYERLVSPGRETVNAVLHWGAGEIRNYGGADIYMSLNGGGFRPIGSAVNVTEFHISLAPYDVAELKAVAYNMRGDRAPMTTAPSIRGTIIVTPGTTNPMTGLSAVAGPLEVALKWVDPVDNTGLDRTEVWSSLTNDRNAATFAGATKGTEFTQISLTAGVARYFWVRGLSKLGYPGEWNAGVNAGVVATPTLTPTRNNFRGAWSALAVGATIDIGDEVTDQNSTWGCSTAHTKTAINGPPTLPTTSNSLWGMRAKVGDTGSAGASAKSISISTTSRLFPYNADGTPVAQTITIKTVRQNSTATPGFVIRKKDGSAWGNGTAASWQTTGYFTRISDDEMTMTHTQFASMLTLGTLWETISFEGYIVDGATYSDTETISIARVGQPVATMDNENHSVPADAAGTVSSYAGATATMKVFNGNTEISGGFNFSIAANPQALTVGMTGTFGNTLTVTGGLDAGEASATLTVRATGTGVWAGYVFDKVFTLGKNKSGAAGANGTNGLPGTNGTNGTTFYEWIAYADSVTGSLNFTTGAPGDRAFIGRATGQTTATESTNPALYQWSQYKGPAAFGLVAGANCAVADGRVFKISGAYDWDAQVYSSESFTGGAFVSFRPEMNDQMMFGLNSDPLTNSSFTSIDYCIYFNGSGGFDCRVNGTTVIYTGTCSLGDYFSLHYRGNAVDYKKNGVTFATQSAPAGLTLWLDSSMAATGFVATVLAWNAAGAAGVNGTNGTNGLPGTNGTNGVTTYTWIAYADSADGSLNFTNGSPGDRVFLGIAANKTTATESSTPGDYTWSKYAGPAAFGLVGSSGITIAGARVIRTIAYNPSVTWGERAFSSEAYKSGAYVSFKVLNTSSGVMCGLNTDPASVSVSGDTWPTLDFALYPEGGGALYAAESGGLTLLSGGWTVSDTLAVHYDNAFVRYYRNGTLLRTVAATPNLILYLDSSVVFQIDSFLVTAFSPAGAAGLAGSNGSNGTNGSNGVSAIQFSVNPLAITIACDEWGAPKPGQESRDITVAATRSGTALSFSSLSTVNNSCTATADAGTKIVHLSAVSANNSSINITCVVDGETFRQTVSITKQNDVPSVNTVVGSVSGTGSYVTVATINVTTSATGILQINGDSGYNVSGGPAGGSATISARLRYTPSGGSPSDIVAVTGNPASYPTALPGEPSDRIEGGFAIPATSPYYVTAYLAGSTTYAIELQTYKSAGSRSIDPATSYSSLTVLKG